MTSPRLLPMSVVLDRVCMSKTQPNRLIKAGLFPKPVPVGQQRVAFLDNEIDQWIADRVRLRDEGFGAAIRRARALRAVGGRS